MDEAANSPPTPIPVRKRWQKTNADWEQAEIDYRAGLLTLTAIARNAGVTVGCVRQRAVRYKWVRDLSAQIREATRIKIAEEEARIHREEQFKLAIQAKYDALPPAPPPVSDREISDKAADSTSAVVRLHLTRARRLGAVVDLKLSMVERWLHGTDADREALRPIMFPTKGDSLSSCERAIGDMIERSTKIERMSLSLDEPATTNITQQTLVLSSLTDDELRARISQTLGLISSMGAD